jgi:hypothetical protein
MGRTPRSYCVPAGAMPNVERIIIIYAHIKNKLAGLLPSSKAALSTCMSQSSVGHKLGLLEVLKGTELGETQGYCLLR